MDWGIKLKFKSYKAKILFWFASVTAILLIAFSFSFYYIFNSKVNSNIENRLQNKAIEIKENFLLNPKKIDKLSKQYDVAILKQHKIVYKNRNFSIPQTKHQNFIIKDMGEYLKATFIYKFDKPYSAEIIIIDPHIDDEVEDFVDSMMVFVPLLLIFLIYFASRLIDKILDPIKSITKIANEININNLLSTIDEPKDAQELQKLVQSFNSMIYRLKNEVEKLERFNSDVSHELKTPLTAILGEIEVTLNKTREPQEYIKSLKTIQNETKNLEQITQGLLLLTKYSNENIKKSFEPCQLDTILLEVIENFNTQLKAKNLTLKVEQIEPIELNANALLIKIIFSNLLDNAIKYSNNDKNIYIYLYKKDKIHFIIKDEGIGIPKEKLPLITQRFYRIDSSRAKTIKGFGLGLSIVQNSIKLHNGKLNISSKEGIGTTVEIIL